MPSACPGQQPRCFKQQGLTLIEIMVAFSIMVVLLLAGTQLTAAWVHGSQTHEAETKLLWSYEQAKALALRNPCQADGTQTAASLVATRTQDTVELQLLAGSDMSTPSCGFLGSRPNPQWKTSLAPGVALQLNGKTVEQGQAPIVLRFSNQGRPLQAAAFAYLLSKGSPSNDEADTLQ